MRLLFPALPLVLLAAACGQSTADISNDELEGADETVTGVESALSVSVGAGATLVTTANLNLRSAPSTSASILRTMPSGSAVIAITGVPQSGWYNVKHNGLAGWAYGVYLTQQSQSSGGGASNASRDDAV